MFKEKSVRAILKAWYTLYTINVIKRQPNFFAFLLKNVITSCAMQKVDMQMIVYYLVKLQSTG